MSDSLAIAATTASLADLLAAIVPRARVTMLRPDAPELRAGGAFLNLALLTAEPFTVPRAAPRQGAGLPPLSLKLTYFIGAHGDEAQLEPQRLLGAALAVLHAQPVLRPTLIAAAIASRPWLAGCDLAASGETIRLVAMPLGPERLSELAASLGAPAVLGAVYEVLPVPLGPS